MEALKISLWDEKSRARIEALQWNLAKDLLRRRQSVIIEWGTWARAERDALREEARAIGISVELHYLSEPADVLWDRIQSRDAESPPMKREQLDNWLEAFEAPDEEEMALFDRVYRDLD